MMRRLNISKDHFEKILSQAEQALNLIGYIPFISAFSGAIRSTGGCFQFLSGLCLSAYFFCVLAFAKTKNIKHLFYLKTSFSHALHGIANIIRAKIEIVPFLSLILCLPYDRLFQKRFKYAAENLPNVEIDDEVIDV